jgi:hypothetical protein
MQSGDADVVQTLDDVAHHLGGDRRLFGDGYVRSSRRGDKNVALDGSVGEPSFDNPGRLMEDGIRHDFGYLDPCIRAGTRHEQGLTATGDVRGNRGNLAGRLALTEDHLRESLTGFPVIVNAGEPEVGGGNETEEGFRPCPGLGRGEAAVGDLVEQLEQPGPGKFLIRQGFSFDSVENDFLQ